MSKEGWIATGVKNNKGKEYYIGENDNYGRVALGKYQDFEYAPFAQFPAKVDDNKKLVPDLEAKTTYQKSDPDGEIFRYATILSERIRNVLRNIENPEKVFMVENEDDDVYLRHLKRANKDVRRLGELELSNYNLKNGYEIDDFMSNEISTAHRAICLIEWPDFLAKSQHIRELEESFKKKYGNNWAQEIDQSEEYNNYKNEVKTLYDKAAEYYDQNNEKFEIK